MRAALLTACGEPLAVRTVNDPAPADDGVVIEVRATGVCRSDWHVWTGHSPVALPHVPGHELAGVVAHAGSGVRRFRVGDRVTAPFCCGCGRCATCVAGETQLCEDAVYPGFSQWGSFAELVAVPHADVNLVRLPDGMELSSAAALGCRFMTAWAAVHEHGRVGAGDWVAVHGCGGVGLAAVMIAAAAGAGVIAIDLDDGKLGRAAELGAAATINGRTSDVVDAVRELTAGGAHVSLDAIGDPAVVDRSIRSLRPRGTHVQVGLLLGDNAQPPVPMGLVLERELRVAGVIGMSVRHYPGLLRAIAGGSVDPSPLVTKTIGLDGISDELALMSRFAQTGVTVVEL